MQNSDYSQLELFSAEQKGYSAAGLSGREGRGSFFNYIRGYEKTVLIIIAFVAVGIISFSMGVEKGKALTLSRVTKDRAIPAQPQKVSAPSAPKEAQTQAVPPMPKQGILESYTVQLASYQTKAVVQKEAEALRKKGFSPLVLSKGKYIVLCVGNFSTPQAAKSLLSEFEKQKRYQGCYIRRL